MYTGVVRGKKEYGGVVELYYNLKKDKNKMKKRIEVYSRELQP